MTTRNRTERRLLDSIRKAKTGETGEPSKPASETPDPGPAPAGSVASDQNEQPEAPRDEAPRTDPYQLGRRVWPD